MKQKMKIQAIVTGATGMVGEGVLHECIQHPDVEKILVIGRRPSGIQHRKVTELLHDNFHDFSGIEHKLTGYNACYFCLGISSVGMNEEKYRKITYDITMALAETLQTLNPDLTFCYVSGEGTDSSEKGRSMWARVKGKTENTVMSMFPNGYAFRPGYIQPTKGLKNTLKAYKVMAPLYPVWKKVFTKYVCTLEHLGQAMIYVTKNAQTTRIIGNKEITEMGALELNETKDA